MYVLEKLNLVGGGKMMKVLIKSDFNNGSETLELMEKELSTGRGCRENKEQILMKLKNKYNGSGRLWTEKGVVLGGYWI